MTDFFANPAVQAGVLPFIVALILGYALCGTRYLTLAVVSGLVVVLALTIGFSPEPFTSVKKTIVATCGATAMALIFEGAGVRALHAVVGALAVTAGSAAVWALLRVIQQMEPQAAWAVAGGAFTLTFATAASAIGAGTTSSLRAAVIGACLGWGAGVLALLGASALLAQLGLALGTASAAVALVQMIRGREAPIGLTVVVPVAVAAPIIGVLASATGELRWYCLIPLPFAPLLARFVPVAALRRPWQLAFATGFAALIPIAVAVGLAWFTT